MLKDANGIFPYIEYQMCDSQLITRYRCLYKYADSRGIYDGDYMYRAAFCLSCALKWESESRVICWFHLGLIEKHLFKYVLLDLIPLLETVTKETENKISISQVSWTNFSIEETDRNTKIDYLSQQMMFKVLKMDESDKFLGFELVSY